MMRDNDNRARGGGSHGGAAQIRPIHWSRTEHQIAPHQGFKPEEVAPRQPPAPVGGEGYTMRLATPPAWTHRDDLPCTKLVPKNNGKDPYDTIDPVKAKALCAGCPVRRDCLADALEMEGDLVGRSRWLIRGAYTPEGRANLSARLGAITKC